MRGAQGKRCDLAQVRRRPVVFAFVSAPLDTPAPTLCIGSLADNSICGVTTGVMGRQQGTYTAEGITKLCEGLKGSAVTSLKCAATPERLLLCQRPLTRLVLFSHNPDLTACFAVSEATTSEQRASLRSLPSSRRRRSPSCCALPARRPSVRFCVSTH